MPARLLLLALIALVPVLVVPASASAAACNVSFSSGDTAWKLDEATGDVEENHADGNASNTWDEASELHFRETSGTYGEFANPDPTGCTYEEGGREVIFPADTTVTDLSVTRRVYVPPTGGMLRSVESFRNTGAAAITIDLAFHGNHYSDTDAGIGTTSNGDATPGTDDDWATQVDTNDGGGDYDSGAGWLNWQSDRPGVEDEADSVDQNEPDGTAPTDSDLLTARFEGVTIEPGQTVYYMQVWGQAFDGAAAAAGAAYGAAQPIEIEQGLTAEERARIRNWVDAGDGDRDGVLNDGDNCASDANADQLNTDGAADGGDVCDADDDNDTLTDEVEAAIGTDPKRADTDADTVNDNADQCPREPGDQPNGCRSEDRPPTVAFTGPAENARLSPAAANMLTADAADDRGVARVIFIDDGRVICEDTAAPFTCAYAPEGRDVGSNTLSAMAVDSTGQTATGYRVVRLRRFAARRVTARTTPSRDSTVPFRFTTRGRVVRPARVSRAQGCRGRVTVQVKSRGNTISTRRARVTRTCTYRSRVTFRVPRRLYGTRLKVQVRFLGNSVLAARRAPARRVRVG